MGKLVFFDLDDTLLNDRKQVPNSAKQAIRELKARGDGLEMEGLIS